MRGGNILPSPYSKYSITANLKGGSLIKKILNFFRSGTFEEVLGCCAIAVVIVPVVINILNRSFRSSYSTNLEAIALLAYVWIGYGFFGYMFGKDSHVDVKFIVAKMGPRMRFVFDLLREVYICLFCCYMAYWGCKLFSTNTARMVAGTKVPLAIGYASIAFGFGTGAVRSFWAIITRFILRKGGER